MLSGSWDPIVHTIATCFVTNKCNVLLCAPGLILVAFVAIYEKLQRCLFRKQRRVNCFLQSRGCEVFFWFGGPGFEIEKLCLCVMT